MTETVSTEPPEVEAARARCGKLPGWVPANVTEAVVVAAHALAIERQFAELVNEAEHDLRHTAATGLLGPACEAATRLLALEQVASYLPSTAPDPAVISAAVTIADERLGLCVSDLRPISLAYEKLDEAALSARSERPVPLEGDRDARDRRNTLLRQIESHVRDAEACRATLQKSGFDAIDLLMASGDYVRQGEKLRAEIATVNEIVAAANAARVRDVAHHSTGKR